MYFQYFECNNTVKNSAYKATSFKRNISSQNCLGNIHLKLEGKI